MRVASAVLLCATLAVGSGCASHGSAGGAKRSHWVGTWQAPPQLTEPRNLPPAPGLANATLRQRFHLTVGGTRLRVRFSNEFGDAPLTIAAVHVAHSRGDDAIDGASDVAVRFGGEGSVTIPAGRAVVSDEVALECAPLSDVAVSIRFAQVPASVTGHPGSRTTSYLATGDHVSDPSLPGAAWTEHWYVATSIDVLAGAPSAAVVVLGNSIADGRGSGTDRNTRWPDNLARRLQADGRTRMIAVLNAGIGGNAVLRGGLGPTALARLDRDVLDQTGARWLIVSEGVNDIGGARGADSSAAVARQLIAAYGEIIARARACGLRVYGATILPFGGSFYASDEHEQARQTVNRWIRESGAFDAVIDFDVALRDPAVPSRLVATADGGDHLHPNEAGYVMMAEAIDLALFGGRAVATSSGRAAERL